jgi:hypothetical protein
MGEGTPGLSVESPRDAARQLDGEISRLREELGELVGELDRRRHEALDVRLQVKRHALAATVTGLSVVAAAAGLVWLGAWRERRQQTLMARSGRLRAALSRAIDRPDRVAAQPTIPERIVGGVLTAAAAALVKKGLERALRPAREAPRAAAPVPAAIGAGAARPEVRWPRRDPEAAAGAPAAGIPS